LELVADIRLLPRFMDHSVLYIGLLYFSAVR